MAQLKDCPPITYVKRRNQRSLRIRVKPDAIIVSGPVRCPDYQMVGFLTEREEWVRKTVQRLLGKSEIRNAELSARKGHTLLHGNWLPMVYRSPRPGSDTWLLVWRNERVDVYPPEHLDVAELLVDHETVSLKLIDVPKEVRAAFEKEWARKQLPDEFETLAETLPFTWSRVFVRSQKTKWGTCSSKGNISLNWRLIKCPENIRRYIMIHELCHTVHMNHSKSYWALVKQYYPETDMAHRWLKKEGELAFM